ncbi:MAG: amidohydrolase family protein [Chloroflexi bacterium]|nr:amidohydrolase family protein [Chloroflexota bacterium]
MPYLLDRMDHECAGFPGLVLNPSDYWHRQGYTTYQDEGLIGELVEFIGVDNVMWGSDYPHPDSVWPDSQQVIESNLKRVRDETVRRKLVCDNVSRLYALK